MVKLISGRGFTASAVADAVNVSLRTVQFWADQGALIPLEDTAGQGRGRQRVFDRSEVSIASMLSECAALKLPISVLKSVANHVRTRGAMKESDVVVVGGFCGGCPVVRTACAADVTGSIGALRGAVILRQRSPNA